MKIIILYSIKTQWYPIWAKFRTRKEPDDFGTGIIDDNNIDLRFLFIGELACGFEDNANQCGYGVVNHMIPLSPVAQPVHVRSTIQVPPAHPAAVEVKRPQPTAMPQYVAIVPEKPYLINLNRPLPKSVLRPLEIRVPLSMPLAHTLTLRCPFMAVLVTTGTSVFDLETVRVKLLIAATRALSADL